MLNENLCSCRWPNLCSFHPMSVFCVITTAINDHFLKWSGILPKWLTGKISDFTGLYFFPFVAFDIILLLLFFTSKVGFLKIFGGLDLLISQKNTRFFLFGVLCLLSAVLFCLLKLNDNFNLFVTNKSFNTMRYKIYFIKDPTDLIALLSLCMAFIKFCFFEDYNFKRRCL